MDFFKMSQTQPLFRLFLSFSQHNNKYSTHLTINAKSVDGVFGIWTQDCSMDGADESTD